MNRSDAERIASLFESLAMGSAAKFEKTDMFVAVMCSVRQMAADRVFGLEQKFKQIRKTNPAFKSILTGCVVESDKTRFGKLFDHILDIKTLGKWPELLNIKTAKTRRVRDSAGLRIFNNCEAGDYFFIAPKNSNNWSALIPISKGCDNYCTYCVVPYTRGRLESRPVGDIINEASAALKNGAREIWLLGQNVNNYHSRGIDFAKLLRLVNDIEGNFWIRFTSPHPKDFNDAAIISMAQCQKVTPYLNLPIQSGDDEILKKMNRPYDLKTYKALVKKLRQAFKKYRHGLEKNLALSTDIIVGFPGETRKQFLNTAKAFRSIKYDMAYIAEYSRRAGTAAAKMDDNVPAGEKQRRKKIIDAIVKKTALAHSKKYKGKKVAVLVDEIRIGGFGLGKTRSYKTVKFTVGKKKIIPGDIVNVKIGKAMAFGLIGKLENEQ